MRDMNEYGDGRPQRGRIERFLGGSPLRVGINLILMSIAVGLLLSWFSISPRRLVDATIDAVTRVVDVAFGSIENVITYFLLGAVIVVPIFLVSRILKSGGRDRY